MKARGWSGSVGGVSAGESTPEQPRDRRGWRGAAARRRRGRSPHSYRCERDRVVGVYGAGGTAHGRSPSSAARTFSWSAAEASPPTAGSSLVAWRANGKSLRPVCPAAATAGETKALTGDVSGPGERIRYAERPAGAWCYRQGAQTITATSNPMVSKATDARAAVTCGCTWRHRSFSQGISFKTGSSLQQCRKASRAAGAAEHASSWKAWP